jgi:hypothetical protein
MVAAALLLVLLLLVLLLILALLLPLFLPVLLCHCIKLLQVLCRQLCFFTLLIFPPFLSLPPPRPFFALLVAMLYSLPIAPSNYICDFPSASALGIRPSPDSSCFLPPLCDSCEVDEAVFEHAICSSGGYIGSGH